MSQDSPSHATPGPSPLDSSRVESGLELRVVAGIHEGATIPLCQRDYTVGASLDCDIVLRDTGVNPQHATLQWKAGRFEWHMADGADKADKTLGSADGIQALQAAVGAGAIVVCAKDTPWTTEPATDSLETTANLTDTDSPKEQPAVQRKSARYRLALLAMASTTALIGAGLAFAYPRLGGHAYSVDEMRAQVSAIVSAQGADGFVRITPQANGLVDVGIMLPPPAADKLGKALQELGPAVQVHDIDAEAMKAELQGALARLSGKDASGFTVRTLDAGGYRIEGVVQNAGARTALLSALKTQLGPAFRIDNAVLTREELGKKVVEELRTLDLGTVDGEWKEETLALKISAPESARTGWESALNTIAERHGANLFFRASFDVLPSTAAESPEVLAALLPFKLSSISVTAPAHVVLSDGSKLFPSGSRDGWRLVDVTAQAAVFDGAQGRRISITR